MTSVLNTLSMNQRNRRGIKDVDEPAVPDSTTVVERSDFSPGQDILLRQKDGRYYFGTVVEVDNIREQCLVKFGDNTDNWSCFKDLVKLSTPEQEDLLCVVCKKSAPKNKHEVTVCDKCGRGYHQHCHQPEIPSKFMKEDSNWMCKRCLEVEPLKQRRNSGLKSTKKDGKYSNNVESPSSSTTTKPLPMPLPYDPDALNWDTNHRVNLEQTYCYCGKKGDWYTQMLQCGRCRQWFHEKCIQCMKFPLYCGDCFYVFVCMNCNQGNEFIRRLELNWVDLVHLILFNLTAYNTKKYYDLDTVLVPYINDNWHTLQLPPKIYNVNKAERREQILAVLMSNRKRFKCGREIKKRTTIWGLRVRLPPPAPCISLTGKVTEEKLKERWQGNKRLQFLPYIENQDYPVLSKSKIMDIIMGTSYRDRYNQSETESPCPSPEIDNTDYNYGAGCVKKSVAHPKISLKHKKRLLSLNLRKRDKLLRRQKRMNDKEEIFKRRSPQSVSAPPTPPTSGSSHTEPDLHTPCDTSGDETSSKSTLDLIIPPPKDFEGKNNPFLTFLRGSSDLENKNRRRKASITLPLPLTAVIPGRPVAKTLKRQLSEKDICIGPNGEVKRRRLRRRNGQSVDNFGQTASKTAAVVPMKPDNDEWNLPSLHLQSNATQINNCVDYALNARSRLRQRQDAKSVEGEKQPPTPKPSPVKQEADIDMDDLKNSVHSYFGAATRISDGERFVVRAKRYGPTGKLEYLMEWEGVSNGMT